MVFPNYKKCICIVKAVKNIQVTRLQKNWSWFQKTKSKENQNVLFARLKGLFFTKLKTNMV